MRGIILAGGTGSRLGPLTKTINKHLLPVGNVPMIFHPLRVLRDNGIEDITIVSSPSGVGQLASLLGSGHEHGCQFTYRVQDQPGGIAAALACAANKSHESVAVILGDNVFLPSPIIQEVSGPATCFLHRFENDAELRQFGVPVFAGENIVSLEEKPANPKSHYAVTGLYVFSNVVWTYLNFVPVGKRGEIEMTDLLDIHAKNAILNHQFHGGFWGDAGTVEGMAECSEAIRK